MLFAKTELTDERKAFYERTTRTASRRCGRFLGNLVPPHPAPACVPALWRYRQVRSVSDGGRTLDQRARSRAPRLVLENPGLRGACRSLTASTRGCSSSFRRGGAQHRHSQSALRFVVEGEGAYTAVDGERTTMHPGDFIITPSWTFTITAIRATRR